MLAPLHVAPLAYSIIAILVAVSVAALRDRKTFEALRMHPYSLYRGKGLFTVLTSVFVHVDGKHLLLNAVFLLIYLPEVEYMLVDDFGPIIGRVLLLVVVAGISWLASMGSALQHRKDEWHWSAGSSHVAFGIIILYFVYFPIGDEGTAPTILPAFPSILIALTILVILFLFVWVGWASAAPIHLYGALAGLLMACLIRPALLEEVAIAIDTSISEKRDGKTNRPKDHGADQAVAGSVSECAFAAFAALDGFRLVGVQPVHAAWDDQG